MPKARIYHNPRCSKSRQTLELLQSSGVDTEIVLYLETPPDKETISELLRLLDVPVREIMRSSEQEFKDQNLSDTGLSDNDLIEAITRTPKLLQRPIVVCNGKAVIGRPPENVLAIV